MLTRFRIHLAYAIGGVANSLALFLLIPYLVQRLTAEQYGTWNLFEITILLVTMIATAGLDIGLLRSYWGENADPPRPLIGTVLIGGFVWGLIVCAVGSAGVLVFTNVLGLNPLLPPTFTSDALLLVLITGVLEGWFALLIAVLRVREQANIYVMLTFGRMVLFLIFVILLVENGGGIMGALWGRLFAALLGSGIALLVLLPHFNWEWRRAIWGRVVRYGLPLLPTNLAIYLLFASDRYVLTAFRSAETVGIYSFMYKLATSVDILVTRPFSLDWSQRRFAVANRPDAEVAFGRIALFYLWIAVTCGLLVFAGTRAIYAWVDNPVYTEGMPYIPLILLGFVAYGLSYPLNIGMILKDRTQWLPPLAWFSVLVYLGLNLWWIPSYGMAGAAWATVVAYTIYTASCAIASHRLYPIIYPWSDILKVVAVTVVAGAGIYGVDALLPESVWLATFLKTGWVLLLMLTLGYLLFGHYLHSKQPAYVNVGSRG